MFYISTIKSYCKVRESEGYLDKTMSKYTSDAPLYRLITINIINYRRYCSCNSNVIIKTKYEIDPILIFNTPPQAKAY